MGGRIEVTGAVRADKNDGYPTVYASGGETVIHGEMRSEGNASAIHNKGGSILVEGNVYSDTVKRFPIRLTSTAGTVTIHGDLSVKREAARAEGGVLTIDGDLILRTRDSWALYATDGEGQVILTGTDRKEAP